MGLIAQNCDAIILSGGKSSRMGTDKSSLVNNFGDTILETLRGALSLFERVLLSNNKVDGIKDIYPNCGPLGGMHASCLSSEKDYLFFVACDMPNISTNAISYMLGSFDNSFDALICKDKSGKIHPTCCIVKRSTMNIMEENLKNKEYKLMKFFSQINTKILDMSIFPEELFFNMNTMDDYKIFLNK